MLVKGYYASKSRGGTAAEPVLHGSGGGRRLLYDEDQYRTNCFDWEKEFPEIFTGGNGRTLSVTRSGREAASPDRERHDRMVALFEEMISLHRRLAADRRIKHLGYDLYNPTEEDIRIIEKD